MRCSCCDQAWPEKLHVWDFGNGLVIECTHNGVIVRFVEDGHTVRSAGVTRAELQQALDMAYGVDR